ncbi:MAG: hypothetical protein QXH35_04545 [Nitrososphaerota archaeon]
MRVEAEIVRRLLDWFAKHGRDYPWRRTTEPYRILIAEMMLQRTKSDQVAGLYQQFIQKYPEPQALAHANVEEIEKFLLPLGLRWRARKIRETGKTVMEMFNGRIPEQEEKLLALPGVGEYAARAVLCFAYGKDVPLVDANVCRVLGRLLNMPPRGEARRDRKFIETAHRLHRYVPAGRSREYNWAILDLAATVCTPRRPVCPECPLKDLCSYPNKTM